MVTATRLRILDPTVDPVVERARLAARLDSLDGKVIGLYNNSKLNAERLLELVAEGLRARYSIAGFVRGLYSPSRMMRREEWVDIEKCDAVLLTNGD
jgi:hypothetical protein